MSRGGERRPGGEDDSPPSRPSQQDGGRPAAAGSSAGGTARRGDRDDGPRRRSEPEAPGAASARGESSQSPPDPELAEAIEGRPDDTDLPLDGHLHTLMSPDAVPAIEVYAEAAVARRIRELAITDHVDFDPGAPAYAYAGYAARERYVRDAAARWADRGVTIRFGVEVTYQERYESDIRGHLARHAYDYAIGSVHVMRDDPYTKERVAGWVAGRSLPEIVAPYFAEVLAAARSGLFDTLGHLDMVKRYLFPHVRPEQLAAAPELYEPILRALVESDTGLEVNTSGLRQAAGEVYPAPWAVARFRELGGTRVTVGSDAHLARSFAFGLGRGYDLAASVGFETVAFREGGTRRQGGHAIAIANPRAARRAPSASG